MQNKYDLTRFDKVMSDVKDIQDKGNFLPDCSSKEGYEASKRFVLDVTTPARVQLNTVHKEVKAPFLDACKMLDEKKKELMPILEAIEAPHKTAYKAVDQAKKEEKARFEASIDAKVTELFNYRNQALGLNSSQLSDLIQQCGETDTEEGFYHRSLDAAKARADSLEILNNTLMKVVKEEAEAEQRAIEAEAQRVENERLEAERAALQEQQKAERLAAEVEARINKLKMIPLDFNGRHSTEILRKISSLKGYSIPEHEFGDRLGDAETAKKSVIQQLEALHNQAKTIEEIEVAERAKKLEAERHEKASAELRAREEAEKQALELAAPSNPAPSPISKTRITGAIKSDIELIAEHISQHCNLDQGSATEVARCLTTTQVPFITYSRKAA